VDEAEKDRLPTPLEAGAQLVPVVGSAFAVLLERAWETDRARVMRWSVNGP
jgi:hypothetical protein